VMMMMMMMMMMMVMMMMMMMIFSLSLQWCSGSVSRATWRAPSRAPCGWTP
jgi:hypothetical protein